MALDIAQCRAWADRVTWACEQVSKEIESENPKEEESEGKKSRR